MRVVVLLVLVAAGAAVAALLVARHDGTDPAAAPGRIVTVGDSLDVGTVPYLADELPGWTIRDDGLVGRSTDDGLAALKRMPGGEPVLVSLGTNDPRGASEAFAADVERALRIAGEGRCLVWATIWRDGGPDAAFDDVLERAASSHPRLRLLRWDELLAAHPEWLAGDGVHATPDGYAARAAEAARLLRACPQVDGS